MSQDKESIRFDGRVVIITGAGRNLGREYARSLLAEVHGLW